MFGDPKLISWLSHRAGVERLTEMPLRPLQKFALQANDRGKDFLAAFGNKEIVGFVCFVDLVGFSERVKGRSASKIATYLSPFLTRCADAVTQELGLVDKTIGDEIMFILPDLVSDGGAPATMRMGSLLDRLFGVQQDLGSDYPMRIGVAYGGMHVTPIQGAEYSEWSVSGECVHLAKRLHDLEGLKRPDAIACAFGVLNRETDITKQFDELVKWTANMGWRVTDDGIPHPYVPKGVSASRCVYLARKSNDEIYT